MKKETFDAAKAIVDRIEVCKEHLREIENFMEKYATAPTDDKKEWEKDNYYSKHPTVRNSWNNKIIDLWHLDTIEIVKNEQLKVEKEIIKLERQLAAIKD